MDEENISEENISIGRKDPEFSLIADNSDKISELSGFQKALLGYPMITISAHYMV